MYGQHPVADFKRFVRAALTNIIAGFAPKLYVRLTQQTGRGSEEESPQQIAEYFKRCFRDYFKQLQVDPEQVGSFLQNKSVLEFGPGDVPAVALLMVAHGAESVVCVDRFPLVSLSPKNIEVMSCLLGGLQGEQKRRAESCFIKPGKPASGLVKERIRYLVCPSGLSGLKDSIDLIISRAVLEHVNNLDATFKDMRQALRKDGVAVHLVDLKSHGLHQDNQLDFLTWPSVLWSIMYSYKGMPNCLRINSYRKALCDSGLMTVIEKPTVFAEQKEIDEVRPCLAKPFRDIADDDLSCLEFWLICSKGSI